MKTQTLGLAAAAPGALAAFLARKGEAKPGGAETVIVATRTLHKPYCYLDEEGDLAGCEYEVLKAVDELLPQGEFKFKTSTFGNMPVALSSRGSVKTLEDLQGKLVVISFGGNSKFYGDKFSEAHKEDPSRGLLLSDPTSHHYRPPRRRAGFDLPHGARRCKLQRGIRLRLPQNSRPAAPKLLPLALHQGERKAQGEWQALTNFKRRLR